MKTCLKCKINYDDKFIFCSRCGNKLQENIESVFCPFCGKKLEDKSDFCPYCGSLLNEEHVDFEETKAPLIKKSSSQNYETSSQKYVNNNYNYKINDNIEFFSVENLFSSNGRIGRLGYFKVCMFWMVLSIVFSFISNVFSNPASFWIISILLWPFNFYSGYCIFVKRFHDLGKSTDFAQKFYVFTFGISLILGIPAMIDPHVPYSVFPLYILVSLFVIGIGLYLIFAKGESGVNEYGPES